MTSPGTSPFASPDPYQANFPRPTTDPTSDRPLLLHSPYGDVLQIKHAGCVLCGIVSSAFLLPSPRQSVSHPTSFKLGEREVPAESPTPTASTFLNGESGPSAPYPYPFPADPTIPSASSMVEEGRSVSVRHAPIEVVFRDNDITVYVAQDKERLCSGGRHLIIILNRHLESVYDLGPADIPLLSHILHTAHSLLISRASSSRDAEAGSSRGIEKDIRVGFVGSIMRDPQLPHAHMHAHAMIGPVNKSLPGAKFFRRNIVFGSLNWWSIEDLRAEIRESTSNNRVKSGYTNRARAPIDTVPDAGAVSGLPNVLDHAHEYRDDPAPKRTPPARRQSKTPPQPLTLAREPSSDSAETVTSPPVLVSPPEPSGASDSGGASDEGFVSVDMAGKAEVVEGKGKGKEKDTGPL